MIGVRKNSLCGEFFGETGFEATGHIFLDYTGLGRLIERLIDLGEQGACLVKLFLGGEGAYVFYKRTERVFLLNIAFSAGFTLPKRFFC